MKLTFTIKQLLDLPPVLQRLADLPFPAPVGLKIGRLINVLQPEFNAAHEQRIKIFRRFGEEKDGNIEVPPDKLPDLQKAIQPLFAEEISIHAEPLELYMLDGVKDLTPKEMLALDPLLKKEQPKKGERNK